MGHMTAMQFEVNLMFTGPSEIFLGSVIRPEKVFPVMKSEGNVAMHEELHIRLLPATMLSVQRLL
jgi:hypothetical protein